MTGLVADEKGPFCLHRRRASGNAEKAARAARVGASFRAPRGPHAEARLRSDTRGRDGGVREKLAAGVVLRSGSPLSGVKRTLLRKRVMSAPEPKRTLAGVLCCGAKRVSALSKHLLEPVRCSLLGGWRVAR